MRAKHNFAAAFLEHEAAGGAVLVAAAAALPISNSPLASLYDRILGTPAGVRISPLALEKPLLLWIDDGLSPDAAPAAAARITAPPRRSPA